MPSNGAAAQTTAKRPAGDHQGLDHYGAIAVRGVMLANPAVVADRLASGVLVRPFGDRYVIASPFTYDLILPAGDSVPPLVQRFIDWIGYEAQQFRASHDKY